MRALGFALVCLVGALVVVDTTIMTMALPAIRRDLGLIVGQDHWVFTAYALPFGGLLLIGGRLGDIFGHRRMFILGLTGLAIASAAAMVAQSASILIGARVLQGVSAAILAPTALALITLLYSPTEKRERAIGIYAAAGSLGFVLGILMGASLTQLLGWRWVMLFNLGLVTTALAVVHLVIPADRGPMAPRRFGGLSALALTSGLAAILFALSETKSLIVRPSGLTLAAAVTGLLLLVGFALTQHRSAGRLIPSELFRRGPASMAVVAMFLKSTIGIAGLYIPSSYLQDVRGQAPLDTAYAFIPGAFAGVVVGVFGRLLIRHLRGARVSALVGLAFQVAGLVGMAALPVAGPWGVLIAGMVIMVAGMVLADVALTVVALSDFEPRDRGVGAGVLRSAAQLGAAVGLVIINTVVTNGLDRVGSVSQEAIVLAFREGLFAGAAMVALAGVVVLFGLTRWSSTSPGL